MELTAEILRNSLIVLHFIGFAAVFGAFMTQMKAMGQGVAKVVPAMVHGAWTLLATGILLVGVREWMAMMEWAPELNHMKIGVKSLVLTVLIVLILVNKKKDSVKAPVFGVIGLLAVLNVVLAVFW
jgi:predicted membrane protein